MLPLFNSAAAMVLALAFLLVILLAPFACIFVALSASRSLRRIAEALEGARLATYDPAGPTVREMVESEQPAPPRISTSLFGR
jgi:hypothetical protein